jgi:hypothetical protein
MARMGKAEARSIAEQVAARCVEQGQMGPVLFDEQTATVLHYASGPALTKILEAPLAVGGLRRIALRAWELKSGTSFHGDKWTFAASTVATNSVDAF